LARQSRRRVLEEAVESGALLVPGHFVAPHIGRVERVGSHYRFVPGP
jgi:hypothetical protein